jgi:hypothetical protein
LLFVTEQGKPDFYIFFKKGSNYIGIAKEWTQLTGAVCPTSQNHGISYCICPVSTMDILLLQLA